MANTAKTAPADADKRAKAPDPDEARKAAAKKAGGKLFPEEKPEDGALVLAYSGKRLEGSPYVAMYKTQAVSGKDGAFYSNRSGSYSALEGEADFWVPLPA